MKNFLRFVLPVLLICFTSVTIPEPEKYPVNYFRSPVNFNILLSGSFGEVRKNHFHSGIDIRTGGSVGKPVYAIADGYVSRIFVSPGGFGKALYLHHPNGFTSVYGHLQSFAGPVGNWVKSQQYKNENFEMDAQVEKNILKVKKGDLIAYSGNSGSSGGPHLHFEIRDTETQETINPVLFGIPMQDAIPPTFTGIKIYPKGENSLVNFSDKAQAFPVILAGGNYTVSSKDTIKVSGNIVFGIRTHDLIDGNGLKTGISSVDLYVDTTHVFGEKIDRFPFSLTRYVNSTIDYPAMMEDNQKYKLSYIVPSNHLPFYQKLATNGVVNFSDSRPHKVRYVIHDPSGNKSQLVFWVKSHPQLPGGRKETRPKTGTPIRAGFPQTFSAEGIKLDFPADALYEDLEMQYSQKPALPNSYSPVHVIHNDLVPIQSNCEIAIGPTSIPAKLISKAVVVRVDESGRFSTRGGKFEEGVMKAQIREFGSYTVAIDTTPPLIRPANIVNGKKITAKQHTIMVKISDNLSGIRYYRGTLNGKWILMDYDAKNAMLAYAVDEHLKPGKNTFRLVVRDATGNEAVYQAQLSR